ncbi:MAG: hypothetical protein F6K08_34345 [Okeania sp. SIO1H6]|nr:hypothetical protein [Okeania sp. SIO1H6]
MDYTAKNVGWVERSETQQRFLVLLLKKESEVRSQESVMDYTAKNVGWVERSETQQR